MGRPIKKIFIGERGLGGTSGAGEGLASVTITDGGTGYTVAVGTALVISAPDLDGGVQAVGTYDVVGGVITATAVTTAGSGYLSAPTVAPAVADTGNGDAVLDAVLTFTNDSVIAATAFVTATDLSADIKSQKGTTRYRVTTSEGTLDCTLVQAAPAAVGEMAIAATDSGTGEYWVVKLFNNTVILVQAGGSAWEFEDNAKVKWATTAVINDSVSITQ